MNKIIKMGDKHKTSERKRREEKAKHFTPTCLAEGLQLFVDALNKVEISEGRTSMTLEQWMCKWYLEQREECLPVQKTACYQKISERIARGIRDFGFGLKIYAVQGNGHLLGVTILQLASEKSKLRDFRAVLYYDSKVKQFVFDVQTTRTTAYKKQVKEKLLEGNHYIWDLDSGELLPAKDFFELHEGKPKEKPSTAKKTLANSAREENYTAVDSQNGLTFHEPFSTANGEHTNNRIQHNVGAVTELESSHPGSAPHNKTTHTVNNIDNHNNNMDIDDAIDELINEPVPYDPNLGRDLQLSMSRSEEDESPSANASSVPRCWSASPISHLFRVSQNVPLQAGGRKRRRPQ
eukprot:GILK01012848.1.p1 GENE.GILK01012848.1~~GILK01012848.1.p1  ORF type:complete len:350 (+),score=26.67 GILK01012848.1:30-1079(+)